MQDNLDLKNVTYFSILPNENEFYPPIKDILKIGHYTSKGIDFYKKIVYSSQEPNCETYDFEVVKIDPVEFEDLNVHCLKSYYDYFESDFMLNFHGDGMIMNVDAWDPDFLNYDYIGAPWNKTSNGGNGGFSLRSKKFCKIAKDLDLSRYIPRKSDSDNEDMVVCVHEVNAFLSEGIKYAPYDVSKRFSTEHCADNIEEFMNSFGFHEIKRLDTPYIQQFRNDFIFKIMNLED